MVKAHLVVEFEFAFQVVDRGDDSAVRPDVDDAGRVDVLDDGSNRWLHEARLDVIHAGDRIRFLGIGQTRNAMFRSGVRVANLPRTPW